MGISIDISKNLKLEVFFDAENEKYMGLVDVTDYIDDEYILLGEFDSEEEAEDAFELFINDWIEFEYEVENS